MWGGGLSKHMTSATTAPVLPPPPAVPVTNAVAFHPVSFAKGWSNLISADPVTLKLPLSAVSSASQVAIEVMKLLTVLLAIGPTSV